MSTPVRSTGANSPRIGKTVQRPAGISASFTTSVAAPESGRERVEVHAVAVFAVERDGETFVDRTPCAEFRAVGPHDRERERRPIDERELDSTRRIADLHERIAGQRRERRMPRAHERIRAVDGALEGARLRSRRPGVAVLAETVRRDFDRLAARDDPHETEVRAVRAPSRGRARRERARGRGSPRAARGSGTIGSCRDRGDSRRGHARCRPRAARTRSCRAVRRRD